MTKQHQERYDREFQRLENAKQGKAIVFKGKIEKSKLEL